MWKKMLLALLITGIALSNLSYSAFAKTNDKGYEIYIKHYKRNGVIIEFPQIKGMASSRKQNEINYLLEKEVFSNIKDELEYGGGKITNILAAINHLTHVELVYTCYVGFASNNLLSIYYDVYSHTQGSDNSYTNGLAYTLDLDKEKLITLEEFMVLDERILAYYDTILLGPNIFSKATSTFKPQYASLADALNVYSGGLFEHEALLEGLKNGNEQWYITSDGKLAIFYLLRYTHSRFTIAQQDIKELIYPEYYEMLN